LFQGVLKINQSSKYLLRGNHIAQNFCDGNIDEMQAIHLTIFYLISTTTICIQSFTCQMFLKSHLSKFLHQKVTLYSIIKLLPLCHLDQRKAHEERASALLDSQKYIHRC